MNTVHELQPVPSVSDDGSTFELPPIVSATEFLNQDLPLPPQLVEGLIHKGSQTLLAGGSKSFKTWCLLNLGICVATGQPFWGFPTTPGRVLYLNFEIDPPHFQKRLQKLCVSIQGDETKLEGFDVWNLRGHSRDIADLAPEILRQCEGEDYSLIIPDPVYKCLGNRNENAAGEVGEFLGFFDQISVETGAAIVYGHHFAKGNAAGKEQLDRASGSGVFARNADGIITLTRHEKDDTFVAEATLRNFAPFKPFGLRWEYPLMVRDDGVDCKRLKQSTGRPPKHSLGDVIGVLEARMTTGEWQSAAQTEAGVPRSTFYELKKQAEAKQLVVKADDGTWSERV